MVEACLFQLLVKPEVLELCIGSLLKFAGDLAVRDVCGNDIHGSGAVRRRCRE